MAQVPEEIVIVTEVDDRASPQLAGIGRNLVMLGANISYVTRAFGIQNTAVDAAVSGLLTLGHAYRGVQAALRLYAVATTASTAANYGFAASFAAINAALGPMGWILMGLAVLGAAVGGFALAGGFSRGGKEDITQGPHGLGRPSVAINIQNANFRTRQETEETVENLGSMFYEQMKRYRP